MNKDKDKEKQGTDSYKLATDFYASQGLDILIPNSSYATSTQDKRNNKITTDHSNNLSKGRSIVPAYINPRVPTTYTFQRGTPRPNPDHNPTGFYIQRHDERPKMKDLLLKPGSAADLRSQSQYQENTNDSRFNPGEDFSYALPYWKTHPSFKATHTFSKSVFNQESCSITRPEECSRKRKYKFEEVLSSGYIPEAKQGKSEEPNNFSMTDDEIDDDLKDIGWRILQGGSVRQISNEIFEEDKNKNATERKPKPSSSCTQPRFDSKYETVNKIPGTFITMLNDEPTLVNWCAHAPFANPSLIPTHTPHNETLRPRAFEKERGWTTSRLLAVKNKLRVMITREPHRETYADRKDLYRTDCNLYYNFKTKTWKKYEKSDMPDIQEPSTSKDKKLDSHNTNDKKRKRKVETEFEQDELFSECIFLPGPSTKKIRHDENNNEQQSN